ncbi:MAG TPA: spore coat U domain-containing protein [Ramlibacter sp.]|uniref:Csu type fimbrial protein n=1 Tax=Ramlibacter sp. TaxID=1917967 RepID=UPI002D8087FC|nr:spore coat U domain-containing protein [Ramlibacter sp.]HET8745748.1 spore coat U domain-containing protein [Ramlibacter sp.]
MPLLLLASVAQGQTVCRVASAGPLAFGEYDSRAPVPKDTETDVSVTCERDGGPQNLTILMRVDQGVNGASVGNRRMAHVGGSRDVLNYGLYSDVSRSKVWGTSDNIDTVTRNLSVPNKGSASVLFRMYGRIPPRQDVSAGRYSDSVQITVMY